MKKDQSILLGLLGPRLIQNITRLMTPGTSDERHRPKRTIKIFFENILTEDLTVEQLLASFDILNVEIDKTTAFLKKIVDDKRTENKIIEPFDLTEQACVDIEKIHSKDQTTWKPEYKAMYFYFKGKSLKKSDQLTIDKIFDDLAEMQLLIDEARNIIWSKKTATKAKKEPVTV